MRLSDTILHHIVQRHIVPAMQAGTTQFTNRAGDIHRELRLNQRMPAVCSVLGCKKLQQFTGLLLVGRHGPHQGANAEFTFSVDESVPPLWKCRTN